MLDPRVLAPCRDGLIERIVRPCRAKFETVILTKPRDRSIIKQDFGHRCKLNAAKCLRCALRRRIKAAHPVQHIAKEVEPDRSAIAGRKDINDTAPNGVVTGLCNGWAL